VKIALVSPYDYPYPGGVTNHVRHLHREFTELGHDVRIMAPSSNRNLEREEDDVYRIGRVRADSGQWVDRAHNAVVSAGPSRAGSAGL